MWKLWLWDWCDNKEIHVKMSFMVFSMTFETAVESLLVHKLHWQRQQIKPNVFLHLHTHNTLQTITIISICLERPSAAVHKKKRVAPQWKMLTLFVWLPECWPVGVGVLIIPKKKKKKPLYTPVILLGVSVQWCAVIAGSGLSRFFSRLWAFWDRRLLRLAHWPCSMSGPTGAKWAWESQFVQCTSVNANTEKHVQTLDYTRLVFVQFCRACYSSLNSK